MSALTPPEVLERRREVLRNQDTDGFAGLFAPDGVIELPFAAPDMSSRLEGRQAIRDFSRHVAASPLRIDDLEPLAVYQTDDPEIIIVELVTYGTLTGTGRTLAGTSIQVFRIRDGKIVLFRDYFNPRGFEELLRD